MDALHTYIRERSDESGRIPADRRAALERLAAHVRTLRSEDRPTRIMFICTHNSRRSHMAQIWAQIAAAHHGIEGVETFSGGTEATAFHPQAVAALQRAGLRIDRTTEGDNPVYEVRDRTGGPAMRAYSKVFDEDPNPVEDFCAVMTCSQADEDCPVIPGAALRVAVPYEDPKLSDGTGRETEVYDERCRQIARELLYLFSRVRID